MGWILLGLAFISGGIMVVICIAGVAKDKDYSKAALIAFEIAIVTLMLGGVFRIFSTQ